jgi:signal peptidase I
MKMRKFLLVLGSTALLVVALAFATKSVAVVKTHGNSMSPRIVTGDLVLVRASSSYGIGDVVAYSSADLRQIVLHRVVSVKDGQYTFRGDHNDFDDPEQPSSDQLIGKEMLHIPQGGIWLDRVTSPTGLGLLAFSLLAGGGGTAVQSRRQRTARRKQRNRPMPQPKYSATKHRVSIAGLSPRLRATATAAGLTAAAGLLLGAISWTQPTTTLTKIADPTASTMAFSYRATVPTSPAYTGTTATSPDPLFRKLVDTAQVQYTYQGAPGSIAVAAELSTASGWHTTLPLQPAVAFDDSRHTGTIPLHLDALEARARAATDVIGIPASQIDITVVATVTTRDGETFAPRLPLTLTPLQLTLAGDKSALTVQNPNTTEHQAHTDNTVGTADHRVAVTTLRTISAILLGLGAVLTLVILGWAALRTPRNEGAGIKRQYGSILLHIEPVTSPPGRPVVDVVDFRALAKLAERYGLLVMHWTRSNVETFIVQDDGITYRYRASTSHIPDTPADRQPADAVQI